MEKKKAEKKKKTLGEILIEFASNPGPYDRTTVEELEREMWEEAGCLDLYEDLQREFEWQERYLYGDDF